MKAHRFWWLQEGMLCVWACNTARLCNDGYRKPILVCGSNTSWAFPMSKKELDCLHHSAITRHCQSAIMEEHQFKLEPWSPYLLLTPKYMGCWQPQKQRWTESGQEAGEKADYSRMNCNPNTAIWSWLIIRTGSNECTVYWLYYMLDSLLYLLLSLLHSNLFDCMWRSKLDQTIYHQLGYGGLVAILSHANQWKVISKHQQLKPGLILHGQLSPHLN